MSGSAAGSMLVALPVADRRTSYDFYRALGLEAHSEPGEPLELGDDGLPEPLQFELATGARLMLIPRGGFGWVVADHEVAPPGQSECFLSLLVGSEGEVDALVERARAAGARVKVEPADPGWGYQGLFADPDGHLWMAHAGS